MANKKNFNKTAQINIKKANPIVLVIVVLCLVVGLVVGWISYKSVTKNDTFILIGQKEITLNVGDVFVDEGVKVISFGNDISNNVKVEGEVNTLKAGEYVLTYTVNNFKYNGVKKIRVVKVVENEQ